VVSLNLNGTVSTLPNEKGNLTVRMGILHSEVNISDLELIEEESDGTAKSKVTGSGSIRMSKALSISPEINLVGKRVDEAMPELEKYLDDAYLSHLPSVRIIHGRGTGALRDAVRSMLKKNKHVKSFRRGVYGEGEDGVTVVTLR
jgi:DNA mismatch repair protein MutS2